MTEESRNSATPGERELMERQISLMENAQKTEASKARWSNILKGSVIFYVAIILVSAAAGYIAAMPPRHDHVAVVEIYGEISEQETSTSLMLPGIREAFENEYVTAIILEIDSPGGLVADSHQLYHELQKLRTAKPVYVAMKRMAASGGYYIAMGAGPDAQVFAEPTTWTGSIGVILPRYNAAELVSKIGVKTEPLVTGPLKGSLSPFRDLREDELQVWNTIIDDSFQRFISVIADNRSNLDSAAVKTLATGQVYTTSQALENGLIDQAGFVEDAISALANTLSLTDYEVVNYASPLGPIDVLLGSRETPPSLMDQLMEAGVPRAFYYCSWNPLIPVHQSGLRD